MPQKKPIKKYSQKTKDGIRHFRVKTFEELRDLIENQIPDLENYVFRGHSNASWRLETTLDRLITHARVTGAKQGDLETFVKAHLDRFRLEIRGRRGDNPPKLAEDELWSLGQHFGLATPLLDWSQSPYISVFFALAVLTEPNIERALWCLHRGRVEQINAGLSEKEKLLLIFPDSDDNKRLLGQSGLFSKGQVMKPLDEWAKHSKANNPVLLRVVFPGDRRFRKAALQKLQLMNINYSTLFPDLSGASLFCNIVSEAYEV